MNEPDKQIVDTLRQNGIAVLTDFLNDEELHVLRRDFTQAYVDAGLKELEPDKRISLSGVRLFAYPTIRQLFIHPRILEIVSAIMNEPKPWIWQVKTNRYTPGYPGVGAHTDGFADEFSPPHTRQSIAVFLDDISVGSGALNYVPGTHRLHYENDEPNRTPPTRDDIQSGEYVSQELTAGSVLFRVPEVWHSVNPIHHLRRYVTASYAIRGRVSVEMQGKREATMTEREQVKEAVPDELKEFWD